MTSSLLRREVLNSFKKIHRTSQLVFKNSEAHYEKARIEINNRFKEKKSETDVETIKELVKLANECEFILKTTVVEFEQIGPEKFKMHIRPEIFEQYNDSSAK